MKTGVFCMELVRRKTQVFSQSKVSHEYYNEVSNVTSVILIGCVKITLGVRFVKLRNLHTTFVAIRFLPGKIVPIQPPPETSA